MGQGGSLFACMSDRDNRNKDFENFTAEKKAPGPTVQLINGVPHLSSPWPVSTDSSLYFSPSPDKFEVDEYVISPFDIMSPSLSRDNELTGVRIKEVANLVEAGDIDGLNFVLSKWRLQIKDVQDENTPLLHLAVISDQFPMVKFLLSQGADVHALDEEEKSAIDVAINCKDSSICPYLIAMATDGTALNAMEPNIRPSVDQDQNQVQDAEEDSISGSSSSGNSVCQTSFISSMEVKQLHKKTDSKKKLKIVYRDSLRESINLDGEESIDDDHSPRKKNVTYISKLTGEQLLSPLSQSSTETTYSSIADSENRVKASYCASIASRASRTTVTKAVIPEAGESEEKSEVFEEIDVQNALLPGKQLLEKDTIEPKVAFLEYQSPKISARSSSSSFNSFVTAKSTVKSPFKKMKKAAGRAFSFVSRRGEQNGKPSEFLKTKL